MKKLHRSYRRLKNETAHGFKPNGTCGRRMWVIHTLGVSSTLIHKRLGHDGTDRASSVIPTAVRFEQI